MAANKQSGKQHKVASPFEQIRPQRLGFENAVTQIRRQTQSDAAKKCATCGQAEAAGTVSPQESQFFRTTSEIQHVINDCLASETCVWKKRFMDLQREKEQIKQKFKEVITVGSTRGFCLPSFFSFLVGQIADYHFLVCAELVAYGNSLLHPHPR